MTEERQKRYDEFISKAARALIVFLVALLFWSIGASFVQFIIAIVVWGLFNVVLATITKYS